MTIIRTIDLSFGNFFIALVIGIIITLAVFYTFFMTLEEWFETNWKWFVPFVSAVCILSCLALSDKFLPKQEMEIVCNDDVTVNELITTYDVVDVNGLVITVKEKKK